MAQELTRLPSIKRYVSAEYIGLYFEFKNTSSTDAINITVKVQHGDFPSESTTLDNSYSVPAGANYCPIYYYVAPQTSETSCC